MVLLLDAYNLLYRSFMSLPSAIVDREGQPINAVYGLVASIVRLSRDLEATHVVAAFDVPDTPTFRHRLYPTYQGHRGPMGGDRSEDFRRQAGIALEALPRVGVATLAQPGYEADDVMGTLARAVSEAGGQAVIVSTDRDLLQLVRPGVAVLVPGPQAVEVRDPEDVRARMGVLPDAIPTLKALAGDQSDNIPGVRGIGPKTAGSLIERYGTLESILSNLETLPERTASALRSEREAAMLFRTLATIVTDLPLPLSPSTLPQLELDLTESAGALLDRMGYPRPGRGEGAVNLKSD